MYHSSSNQKGATVASVKRASTMRISNRGGMKSGKRPKLEDDEAVYFNKTETEENSKKRVIAPKKEKSLVPTRRSVRLQSKASVDPKAPSESTASSSESTAKSSRGKSSADQNQKSSSATANTMMNNEIEKNVKLRYLLTNSKSRLAKVDMKLVMPKMLQTLSLDYRKQLALLLPEIDRTADGDIHPDFYSPANNFFWESAAQWQKVLAVGGFTKTRQLKKQKQKELVLPYKDDAYEEYWGQRVERNRK